MSDQRRAKFRWVIHNVVAHPALILCPPFGRWLHRLTAPEPTGQSAAYEAVLVWCLSQAGDPCVSDQDSLIVMRSALVGIYSCIDNVLQEYGVTVSTGAELAAPDSRHDGGADDE